MGSRLSESRFDTVYATAQKWVDSALRTDGSVFTPDKAIWRMETLQELRLHFLEQPDAEGPSFMGKLRVQLEGCSAEAYQLMGEVMYVHFLITDRVTPQTKASRINEVLSWSPSPMQLSTETVAGLSGGILGTGGGFGDYRPFYVGFILELVQHWKNLPSSERDSLLGDPWEFKRLLSSVPLTSALLKDRWNRPNLQRLALLHLVFPDTFEAIVASQHKSKIATTFANLVTEPAQDVDRQLQQIREQLVVKHGDHHWLFYHDPIKRQWDPPAAENGPWDDFVAKARSWEESGLLDEQETNYKIAIGERLAEARVTVLAGHEGWRELVKRGLRGNLVFQILRSKFIRWMDNFPNDALEALRSLWRDGGASLNTRIQEFSDQLPYSDVGGIQGTGISGPGTRASLLSVLLMALDVEEYPPYRSTLFDAAYKRTDYTLPPPDADEAVQYEHALGFLDRFIEEAASRDLGIVHRLEAQSLVWMVINEGGVEGEDETSGNDEFLPETLEALAEQVYLPVGFLEDIKYLIEEKKQVIFQGPPGTGKTFVARALAKFLAGGVQDHVTLVQFHPSYAYEDFVEGIRPVVDGQGTNFQFRDGALKQIAKRAQDNEEKTFVLVIDEINRGNLGKVFGELYFLLEYRDSKIRLQYSDEEFSLPNNLYVIGTMNTADRSIALVDLALRRRFYFKDFHPDEEPVKNVLRHWLQKNNPAMEWVADLVAAANEKMADDRHAAIGPSYFMQAGLDIAAVKRIWDHSVLPYIEERFFGDQDQLDGFHLSKLMPTRFPVSPESPSNNQNDDATEGGEQPNPQP